MVTVFIFFHANENLCIVSLHRNVCKFKTENYMCLNDNIEIASVHVFQFKNEGLKSLLLGWGFCTTTGIKTEIIEVFSFLQ